VLIIRQTSGQKLTIDSVKLLLKNSPTFTIYKDNYFISGIPTNGVPNKYNSDAKFQISFKHRITDARLPFDSYLFLTYTQKSFWNIYRESKPFGENNYNPTLGLAKLINTRNGPANIVLAVEHESNGRDGIYSRSWNKVVLQYMFFPHERVLMGASAWIPFGYKTDNPDLIKYVGYGEIVVGWRIINDRLFFDAVCRKGSQLDLKGSLQAALSVKLGKKQNHSLMLQWFTGYAESLIDYNKKSNMIRLGIVLKPMKLVY
jgi:phospholipase A1